MRNTETGPEAQDASTPQGRVDCTVIVITYNSADHIEPFLDSLPAAAGALTLRCVIVDNDSADQTPALVAGRPDVTFVSSGGNVGYAAGINIGRRFAGNCSSILIANPDLEFEPQAIEVLHGALDEPGVGVAVPMLLEPDGHTSATLRREPTILRSAGEALFGDRFGSRPEALSESIRDLSQYEQPQDTDWATGAAFCISTECDSRVGAWDEDRFFLYSEETDFARRARALGYRIRYVPGARARHESGGSGRPPLLDALGSVNRIRYYEKYHGRPAAECFRATIVLKHLLRFWDSGDRLALGYVCSRSRWKDLPGGRIA
jgi:N-acetylglucosaminyl-diphospho-decaprenol L-rhamnosyltransferase